MNVVGEPIDERGPIKGVKKPPIHADRPAFVDRSTTAEVLGTGIKAVDLLAPYARGGKTGLSECQCRKDPSASLATEIGLQYKLTKNRT